MLGSLMPVNQRTALLTWLSRIAVLVGAVGSVDLLLRQGRHNPSRLLMILFTLWVLAPFVILAAANAFSKRWSVLVNVTLHSLTLGITVASLAIYAKAAMSPPRAQGAFVFVAVPPATCLLIAIIVPIAARISGRGTRIRPGT
jgi:hypothetical protein